MLQLWTVLATSLLLALASLGLLRGLSALLVARRLLARLEALGLVLAGIAGWAGVITALRSG